MKKYITPQMQVAKFDKNDSVLTLSGTDNPMTLRTWGSNIRSVTPQDFNVFE